jgi:hypothetical protein
VAAAPENAADALDLGEVVSHPDGVDVAAAALHVDACAAELRSRKRIAAPEIGRVVEVVVLHYGRMAGVVHDGGHWGGATSGAASSTFAVSSIGQSGWRRFWLMDVT